MGLIDVTVTPDDLLPPPWARNKEPVAITLTREQWYNVLHALEDMRCGYLAKMWTYMAYENERLGKAVAAEYEHSAALMKSLHDTIEDVLIPPPEPETE